MKMELAKLCQLLAASFLFLSLLTDPTAACSCGYPTPQVAYCLDNFLVLARVLSDTEDSESFKRIYHIKVTKVLKGPEDLKESRKLYTALQGNLCGYEHPTPFNKDVYLFSVRKYNDGLSTSLCKFNTKWDELSKKDKRGFNGRFKKSCN